MRPPIFLPRLRVICRLTSALHRLADGALVDRAFHVGELGIESLRVADGEEQRLLARDVDQVVRFPQFQGDGLFEKHDACPPAGFPWPWGNAWSRAWRKR